MEKKGNAVLLLIVAAVAIVSILIYTSLSAVDDDSALLSKTPDAEVTLFLEDALNKGVLDFLDHGFSNDESTGPVKGTSAWHCNIPLPPDLDESIEALKLHVKKRVDLAINQFNTEYDDVVVSWPGIVEVNPVDVSSFDDLPDESFSLTLKDIKVTVTYEEESTEKVTDVPYDKPFMIWKIYKEMQGWLRDDYAGHLTRDIAEYVRSKECKARSCSCQGVQIDDELDLMDLERDKIIDIIDDSMQSLISRFDSGITCGYTILNEDLESVRFWDSASLAPDTAGFTMAEDVTKHKFELKCATNPVDASCSNPADSTELMDDLLEGADPAYGTRLLGEWTDPATRPDPSRPERNFGCPTADSSFTGIDPRTFIAVPEVSLTTTYDSGDTEVEPPYTAEWDPAILAPRIDKVGMHKKAAFIISVNCQDTSGTFLTAEGDKPVESKVLIGVYLYDFCPPPGDYPDKQSICASGECWVAGTAAPAGIEWLKVLGKDCTSDADCDDPLCFHCAADGACKIMKTKLFLPQQCHMCKDGVATPLITTGPPPIELGCGNCGHCSDGDCVFNPETDGLECGGTICKYCDPASMTDISNPGTACVTNPSMVDNKCKDCKMCAPDGSCTAADLSQDNLPCATSDPCRTAVCLSGECKTLTINEGVNCGSSTFCGGVTIPKRCTSAGKCELSSTPPDCCGSEPPCGPGTTCCAGDCIPGSTCVTMAK